jgi:hypothetical protein
MLLTGLFLTLLSIPAGADRDARTDANNSAGPLDIARIVYEHRPGNSSILVHKVVMQERWTNRVLSSSVRDNRGIRVTFNIRPRVGYSCIGCITEREVFVDVKDGDLRAILYNHLGDPPRKIADLRVWRPNRRTVAFALKKRQLMRRDRDHYDWGVGTIYMRRGDESCPRRDPCFDLAPGRQRLLRHDL